MPKVYAHDITRALALRHKDEFFVTECKNGPSNLGYMRFDAVAIYKSWATPRIVIYEVKVSRSDFLSDAKFYGYLPYCHEMYFVVPKGLIDRNEVPENIGLIYYNPDTGKLVTKRKAVYRKITPDPNMLFYIFMNKIDSDRIPFYSDKREHCEAWVKDKINTRELGRTVSSKLVQENIDLKRRLNNIEHLERVEKDFSEVRKVMRNHNINVYGDIAGNLEATLRKKGGDLTGVITHLEIALEKAKKLDGSEKSV